MTGCAGGCGPACGCAACRRAHGGAQVGAALFEPSSWSTGYQRRAPAGKTRAQYRAERAEQRAGLAPERRNVVVRPRAFGAPRRTADTGGELVVTRPSDARGPDRSPRSSTPFRGWAALANRNASAIDRLRGPTSSTAPRFAGRREPPAPPRPITAPAGSAEAERARMDAERAQAADLARDAAEVLAQLDAWALEVLELYTSGQLEEADAIEALVWLLDLAEQVEPYLIETTRIAGMVLDTYTEPMAIVGDIGSDIANWWKREAAPTLERVDRAADPYVSKVLEYVPGPYGDIARTAHGARMGIMYGDRNAAAAPRPGPAPTAKRGAVAVRYRDVDAEIASLRDLMRRSAAGDPTAQNRVRAIKDGAAAGDPTARRQWRAMLALSVEIGPRK